MSIRLILQELYAAGVEKKDILLICSNGLHRKNTEQEIRGVLGDELFNEFWYTHQIINHDSEDYDHLVDLGTTDRGDPVLMNKYVYESDVAILIGHTQVNRTAVIPEDTSTVQQVLPTGDPLHLIMFRRLCIARTLHR